jgi:hypothetical protein
MADLDLETVEKVVAWCAEAGRRTTPAEVRAALGTMSWDELLAARALLAEPPPLRQLGPHGLADMARGAPADVAAEREREGRYPRSPPPGAGPPLDQAQQAQGAALPLAGRRRGQARGSVIVRKKGPAPAPPAPVARPLLDELLLPPGRATLGRLVRAHGGRRPALLTALAATHRRPDGLAPAEADLERLLEHHGLTRSFARRERDEVLHAIRAAGGVLPRAAVALGYDEAGLVAAVARLGCAGDVEALRAGKRRDLAGRATLSDRARLLVADPEKLRDLGLLEPFESELRARLPELLQVLGRSGEPLAMALARSVALPVRGVRELATRLGFDLGPIGREERNAEDRPVPRFRADAPVRPARPPRSPPAGERPARPPRPAAAAPPSPSAPRAGARGPEGAQRPGRPGRSDRPGRPSSTGDRPPRGTLGGGARPFKPRTGPRPSPGPAAAARAGSSGRTTPRPGGVGAPRSGSPRPGGTRRTGARPAGPARGLRRPPRTP